MGGVGKRGRGGEGKRGREGSHSHIITHIECGITISYLLNVFD